jgi:hypothetical protein
MKYIELSKRGEYGEGVWMEGLEVADFTSG